MTTKVEMDSVAGSKGTRAYINTYFKVQKEGELTRECLVCGFNMKNSSQTNLFNHIKFKHQDYKEVYNAMERAAAGGGNGEDLRQTFLKRKNERASSVFNWLNWIVADSLADDWIVRAVLEAPVSCYL